MFFWPTVLNAAVHQLSLSRWLGFVLQAGQQRKRSHSGDRNRGRTESKEREESREEEEPPSAESRAVARDRAIQRKRREIDEVKWGCFCPHAFTLVQKEGGRREG